MILPTTPAQLRSKIAAPPRGLRLAILSAALALTTILPLACKPTDSDRPAEELSNAEVDRLRALPYAGGTPANPNEPTGVIHHDAERTCPGYRLYTVQMQGIAELIDEAGQVTRAWQIGDEDRWERCELLPDGDVLVIGSDGDQLDSKRPWDIPTQARYVARMNWGGELKWKHHLPAHHDLEQLPDGRIAVLTFEQRRVPAIHPDIDVRDDRLTLLDADGNVLTFHSLLDAFRNGVRDLPLHRLRPVAPTGEPWFDLLHSNSVEWMRWPELAKRDPLYSPENVLVCVRHQDRVALVDWPHNQVVWQWGVGEISGPHDAQMLANGHILLFDNGLKMKRSRAVELNPLHKKIVWQYEADPPESFYTESKGSVQRLPNGNTLLAESDKGRAIEVTTDGEVVWEFICPHRLDDDQRAAIVRMVLHPRDRIDELLRQNQ